MTPKQLVDFAKQINPGLLENDPEAAIKDAYMVSEAIKLAKIVPANYVPPALAAKVTRRQSRDAKLTTIDHLKLYMQREKLTANAIAEKMKLGSTSALYHWLRGKYKPNANSIAKIEAFLTDAGYYE